MQVAYSAKIRKIVNIMTKCIQILLTLVLVSATSFEMAAQQQPKKPDPEEIASKEADRLAALLNLEDWQIFYVDSTLNYNFGKMQEEMEQLQKSKVENANLYYAVQDEWMEKTDRQYQKIFTAEQWTKYLKTGAARQQKARDKRKAKVSENALRLKKK